MLRRRTHTRSTRGCLTCKERHVRCDERLPYCRNCIRLGRECLFEPKICPVKKKPRGSLELQFQTASTPNNWPNGYTIYCGAPHQKGISSPDINIVHQARAFASARPMPASFWKKINKDYIPNYTLLAVYHDSVKHSMVAFAAYTHFQGSKNPVAEDVCVRNCTLALQDLQREIDVFGPLNSDAILSASVLLAGTSQNWDGWSIFMEGYSKALAQSRASNFKTVFPEVLPSKFQLRQLPFAEGSFSEVTQPGQHIDETEIEQEVESVLQSIISVRQIIDHTEWYAIGFECLERLAQVVKNSIKLSETDRFHRLASLRSWMFWVDLRNIEHGVGENVLSAQFYALLVAIVPIIPGRYRVSFKRECIRNVQVNLDVISKDSAWDDVATCLGRIVSGHGSKKLTLLPRIGT